MSPMIAHGDPSLLGNWVSILEELQLIWLIYLEMAW